MASGKIFDFAQSTNKNPSGAYFPIVYSWLDTCMRLTTICFRQITMGEINKLTWTMSEKFDLEMKPWLNLPVGMASAKKRVESGSGTLALSGALQSKFIRDMYHGITSTR